MTATASESKLDTLRLTYDRGAYKVDKPGDRSGEYVRAEDASKAVDACARALNYLEWNRLLGDESRAASLLDTLDKLRAVVRPQPKTARKKGKVGRRRRPPKGSA